MFNMEYSQIDGLFITYFAALPRLNYVHVFQLFCKILYLK